MISVESDRENYSLIFLNYNEKELKLFNVRIDISACVYIKNFLN